jgi:hypothetical protein
MDDRHHFQSDARGRFQQNLSGMWPPGFIHDALHYSRLFQLQHTGTKYAVIQKQSEKLVMKYLHLFCQSMVLGMLYSGMPRGRRSTIRQKFSKGGQPENVLTNLAT